VGLLRNAALQNGDIGYGRSVLDLGCGTGMLSIGSAIVGTSSVTLVDCDEAAIEVARNNLIAMDIINDPDDSEDGYDDDDDACVVDFLMAKLKHKSKGNNSGGNNSRGGRGRGRGRNKGRGGGRSSGSSSRASEPIDPPSRVSPTDDGVPLASNCVDTVMTNPPFGTKPGNAGIDVTFLRTAIRLARRSVYSFHKSSTREYLLKTVASWGYQVEVVAQMKFDIPKMYKFHSKDIVDVDVDLIRVIVDSDGDVEEEQEDR